MRQRRLRGAGGRLLDILDVIGRQPRDHPQRHRLIPRLVRIEPQPCLRRHFPHGTHGGHVMLGPHAHLQVQYRLPLDHCGGGILGQRLGRLALQEVEIPHILAHRPAQQIPHRPAQNLALRIQRGRLKSVPQLVEIPRHIAPKHEEMRAVGVLQPLGDIEDRPPHQAPAQLLQHDLLRIGIRRGGRLAIAHRAILAGHGDQVDGERILDPLRPDVGLAQRKAQRGGGNGRDKGHGAHPEAKEFRRRLGRARRPRKPENAQTCRVCDKTSR